MKRTICLIACALAINADRGFGSDYSLFFTVSNDVSPEQPSTTVTMWAKFDPKWYAFGMTHTEVRSGPPDRGNFADPRVLMKQYYLCDEGEVSPEGDRVLNIRLIQLHLLGGMFADTANPIELWSVTWTTDDFKARQVPIWTQSSDFWVYITDGGIGKNFYGPEFSEAQGVIRVVPAPAGAAAIGVGALLARRRRHRARAPGEQRPAARFGSNSRGR